MSLTGASADEWIPAKPGTEGVLALSMANYIVERGYYRGRHLGAWKSLLAEYSPKKAAGITGVDEERIKAIAKGFAAHRPSLAIGGDGVSGYDNGISSLVAINILNHIAGNIGVDGGLVPNPEETPVKRATGGRDGLAALIADASASKVSTLILHGTNPVFTAPGGADVETALKKIPFIASFSPFMDETTAMADIILPSHTALEDWGDDFASPSVGYAVATMMQPAVSPLHNTRGIGDIYIGLGRAIGGKVGAKMPAKGYKEYLKSSWKGLYGKDKAMSASALDFTYFWKQLLERGGWWPEPTSGRKRVAGISPSLVKRHIPKAPAGFSGDASK